MSLPSAIRLPSGKVLTRHSSRGEIWAVRRDAVMGKLEPGEEINELTYQWMNDNGQLDEGDGRVVECRQAVYGNYQIKDDYSFFAIYDPACYQSFVSNFWNWESLQEHFLQQMKLYRFLIASAGQKGEWRINIKHEPVLLSGAREATGSIQCAGTRLILCDYGHLTMGAQFDDIKLPDDEPFGAYEMRVRPGTYNIRIIQLNMEPAAGVGGPDIILEILKANNPLPHLTEIIWSELGPQETP
jgi:hypothetical protein